MNRYEISMPRAVLSFAAVAAAALILGVAVVAPAKSGSANYEAALLAGSQSAVAAIETTLSPSRIEVIGVREQKTAYEPARQVSKAKQQS